VRERELYVACEVQGLCLDLVLVLLFAGLRAGERKPNLKLFKVEEKVHDRAGIDGRRLNRATEQLL